MTTEDGVVPDGRLLTGGAPTDTPPPAVPDASPGHDDIQRRTVRVLVASQVLGGVGVAGGIAVGGLLAEQVSDSTALSGLAQTATVLGGAVLAVPLARLATGGGRRVALALGYLLGLVGAAGVLLGALASQFWIVLVGLLLFGGGTASGLQARYAATDAASSVTRGRSLSVVVWATTVGAVAGPNLSGVGGHLGTSVGVPSLAGPFLISASAFLLAALTVWTFLRPDPLTVAGGGGARASVGGGADPPRPRLAATFHTVRAIPAAGLGMGSIATAHAVMVGVMVMTPVHLGHGGASLQLVGVVISLHVAGMYAASPVMGWLADRVGRVATIGIGLGVLVAALLLAALAEGGSHTLVAAGMVLLGLGWSAVLVAGSTLLSESVPAESRTSVQGASDLVMGLAGAAAGALGGPVLQIGGYAVLAGCAGLLLLPVVLLMGRQKSARQPAAQ